MCAIATLNAQNIYVDSTANGLNNGTSWANAYVSLDSALSKTLAITDTIKIAKGTYKPNSYVPGGSAADNRDKTFLMPLYGYVLGGYPSGGGLRNSKANKTILSGDIGVTGDNADNVYHVMLVVNSFVSIDGLIIEHGNANGNDAIQTGMKMISRFEGGGIFIHESESAFSNVVLRNNVAHSGAGCIMKQADVQFTNAFFLDNNAEFDGGGIKNDTTHLALVNTVFSKNYCDRDGGAIMNKGAGNFSIWHSTFYQNGSFNGRGGAVFNENNNPHTIHSTIFNKNFKGSFSVIWDNGVDIENVNTSIQPSFCQLQTYVGGINSILNDSAYFNNVNSVAGNDNQFGTYDDGLRLCISCIAKFI